MFDRFDVTRRPARARAGLFALGSIAAHGLVVAGLLASAMWQIEKLRPAETPVVVASRGGALDLPVGDPAPTARPEKPRRRVVRELRQIAPEVPVDEPATDDGGDAGEADDGGDGDGGGGTPGGAGIGALGCDADDCSGLDLVALPPPPAPPPAPRTIRSTLIEGHRIHGDPRIGAPDAVRAAMRRAGEEQVIGTVAMCLDRGGRVASLRLARSTGHPAYDARLLAEMRSWAYRPYRLDSGEAVPVCTAITFVYRMR